MRLHTKLAAATSAATWRWATALLCIVASTSSRAFAQDEYGFTAAGVQAGRSYASQLPFERIDPYSGSLILSFTDVALPGNAGLDLRWVRTFNSNPVYSPVLTAGGAWSFGLAGIPMVVLSSDVVPGLYPPPPIFVTPDGGSHTGMYKPGLPDFNHVITTQFWEYDRAAHTLLLPNGWVVHYDQKDGNLNTRYPSLIEDPFGNTIELEYDETVPSCLENVHQILPEGTRTLSLSYDGTLLSGVSYGGRTWTYSYDSERLRYVTPPAGPAWEYQYADSVSPLLTVVTPGGGHVSYGIVEMERPGGAQNVWTPVVTSRTTSGPDIETGTWTFEYGAGGSPFTVTSSIAGPSSTTSYAFVTDLNSPAKGRAEEITFSSGGNTVRHEHLVWAAGPQFGNDYVPGRVPLLMSHAVTQDDQTYITTYAYGSADFADYGNPAQIVQSGGIGRTITRAYEHLVRKGALTEETTTVNGESFTAHYDIDSTTGILEHENVYGIERAFGSANGNITSETDAHGHTTTYDYAWGTLSAVTPPVPDMAIARGINEDGSVAWESHVHDGSWVSTSYEYDALGRLTWVQPPVGNGTTTIYDDDHGIIRTERGDFWSYTIGDGFGHPVYTVDSLNVRNEKWYDAEFRLIYDSYPFFAPDNVGDYFSYDALGRPTRQTHAGDGTYTATSYGPGTISIRDESGRTTVQHWGMFVHGDGRLTGVTDAAGQTWTYAYNGRGSLTAATAPDGLQRTWSYDARNLLQSEAHPESGAVAYTYDAAGLLTSKTDANQNTFFYHYDANERPVRMTVGGRETTIAYEPGSDQPATLSTEHILTSFQYDAAGRQTHRTDSIDGMSFTSAYEYNGNDQIQAIVYPTGRRVQYELDGGGRPSRVFDGSTNTDYASDFAYHASGALTTYKTGNGIVHTSNYEPLRYRLTNIDAGNLHLTYATDNVGNVGAIGDSRPGMSQTFTYDNLDRLTSAAGPYGNSMFAYDVHGNRQNAGGATYTYQPGTLRLTGQNGVTFGYDANGNMTSAGGALYDYNRENRMEASTVGGVVTNYLYDADGWRVRQSTGNTVTRTFRGLSGELLTEWTGVGVGSVATDSIYAAGKLIAVAKRTLTPPPPKITNIAVNVTSPIVRGTSATWTVTATGGTAPYTYKFWVYDGSAWTVVRDWATSNSFSWTPAVAGTYHFQVWLRNDGSPANYDASKLLGALAVTDPPGLSITSLVPGVAFPVWTDTPVSWTAMATGGEAPYTFRFYVNDGSGWTLAQDWSTSNVFNWTSSVAGSYSFISWARNAGSTGTHEAALGAGPVTVTVRPPLTITGITSNFTSSVPAGTETTWTTTATGGHAPYTFRFWVFDGTAWTIVQDWTTSNVFHWTPAAAGTYSFQVWGRNAGSTGTWEAWLPAGPVTVTERPPLTITGVSSNVPFPVPAGTPTTWTATASGGYGPYTYRFYVFNGTTWTLVQDWTSSNTFTWMPTVAGTYSFQVWARNAGSTGTWEAWLPAGPVTVTAPGPLSIVSATPAVAFPIPAGNPITWTAQAVGGQAPYSYRFWVYNGTAWTMVQDWTTSNSFQWTPTVAGTYTFQVWARNAGSTGTWEAWLPVGPVTITSPGPLTITSVTPDVTFPIVAGTPVTWTAQAGGGQAPYTYRFWVFDGTSWTVVQDWTSSNVFTWTPGVAGTYSFQVWSKSAGSTATWDAWLPAGPVGVTAP